MISSLRAEGIPQLFLNREREAGDQILNVENLSKSIEGEVVFKNIDINLTKGDKVVLLSRDSRAVTAFYQIVTDEAQADSGNFKWGITTTQAYLPVENSDFFENQFKFGRLVTSVC